MRRDMMWMIDVISKIEYYFSVLASYYPQVQAFIHKKQGLFLLFVFAKTSTKPRAKHRIKHFLGSLEKEQKKEASNRKRQFAYSDFAPMHTQAK